MTDNLPDKPIDRDTKLALNMVSGLYDNVQEMGIKAGFSESYVKTGAYYRKLKSESFRRTLQETAELYGITTLLPLRLNHAYKALTYANKDSEQNEQNTLDNDTKLAHIDRLVMALTRIQADKPAPQATTINIKELRLIHSDLNPNALESKDIVDVTPDG